VNTLIALAGACLALAVAAPGAGAAPVPCTERHWVGVWAAPPSDASRGTGVGDTVDGSGNLKSGIRNDTTRAILTPTLGGSTLRVRLSNRFGTGPVTFGHVMVARRLAGASLVPGTATELRFSGRRSVTVAAGGDVISDAADLPFEAFQPLAIDVWVPDGAGKPTEHFSARQTSYLTPDGAGDEAGEQSGSSFTERTTGRPFVVGVDVLAQLSTGAVVAFGDSLTDGYQGSPVGFPEAREGLDADARYPDVLARRLRAAGRPLAVLNMGIGGNRVLRDGSTQYGPSALRRLGADVLGQAGVTTVVWMEGLNDIGQSPPAGVEELIEGYRQGIARMRAAGLRVLQGTLTPFGNSDTSDDGLEAKRRRLNDWIRTSGTADGVIDFDAAVRDPASPHRLQRQYDGGDGGHLNSAGYRALGEAVPLDLLRDPACARTLDVRVTPRRLVAGRRTTLRIVVQQDSRALRGAVVRFASARATTGDDGVARLRVRARWAGVRTLTVTADNAVPRRVRVRIRRPCPHG
jgi:lysophospholipase L1-like esterase